MVSIPTPIPEYIAERVDRFFSASLGLILYRLALTAIGLAVIVIALTSFGAFVGILISIVLSVLYSDDIRQTVMDIWNLDFWEFET